MWPDATPSADPSPCTQTPPDTLCLCSSLFRPESASVSPCAPAHNAFTSSGKKTIQLFLFYADKSPYARGQSLNFEVKISGDKLENDSDSLKKMTILHFFPAGNQWKLQEAAGSSFNCWF